MASLYPISRGTGTSQSGAHSRARASLPQTRDSRARERAIVTSTHRASERCNEENAPPSDVALPFPELTLDSRSLARARGSSRIMSRRDESRDRGSKAPRLLIEYSVNEMPGLMLPSALLVSRAYFEFASWSAEIAVECRIGFELSRVDIFREERCETGDESMLTILMNSKSQ